MRKYSIRIVLLLLIVSVFVMSCDDLLLTSRLNQDDVDNIATAAAIAFMHVGIYLDPQVDEEGNPFSVQGIGDEGFNMTPVEGIGDEGDRIVLTWDNFDVGFSMNALLDDETVPENIKNGLIAVIDLGQLVILEGSADFYIDEKEADIQMKLKIDNLESEMIPSGTYDIVVTIGETESEDEDEEMYIEITVNGVLARFNLGDLQ